MSPHPSPVNPAAEPEAQTLVDVPTGPGVGWYVVALLAGIPVFVMMGWFALDTIRAGHLPGVITLAMVAASGAGSVVTVVGMRSRPRRFRALALLMTLPAAIILGGAVTFFVLWIVVLISSGA